MSTTDQIIVLTDGTQSFYLLKGKTGYHGEASLRTDSGPLTFVRDASKYNTGWWSADGPPSQVTITSPGRRTKVGFRLRNPAAESEAFPLNLTVEQYSAVYVDDDTMTSLYETLYETGADEVETIPVEAMTVIADSFELAPQDGLVWRANAIEEVRRHPELLHLVPGQLLGFRKAAVEAIERLPFMRGRGMFDAGAYEKDGHIVAHASTPYEPHHTRFVRDTGRNGQPLKRGRTVTETKTLRVSFMAPGAIVGANRAEAVQRWHEALTAILEDVTAALTPAPCWHCDGTGIVSEKSAAKASA